MHFGMSGLNSAVSILELLGHDNRALNTLGMGARGHRDDRGHQHRNQPEAAMEPLKRGSSGWITRMGGVLSGPVPLALRIASAFAGERRSRQLRQDRRSLQCCRINADAHRLDPRRTRVGAQLAIAAGD